MTDSSVHPAWPDFKVPTRVEARAGFHVWVEFDDGVSGEVDLSDLANQPQFAGWRDRAYFEQIRINGYDHVQWGALSDDTNSDQLPEVDPDELYSRLTGIPVRELYPEWEAERARRGSGPSPTDVVAIEPREGFCIWVEFVDGTNGVADLSFLANGPAFAEWKDRDYFESVRLDGDGVIWGDDLARCGYALYIDVTGLSPEEVMAIELQPVHV